MASLLGVDPGLGALGMAVLEVHARGETVLSLEAVRTTQRAPARGPRASGDDLRRVAELAAALEERISPSVVAIAAEAQPWPRTAAGAAGAALAWGVIGTLAHRHGLLVLRATPREAREAVACGRASRRTDLQVALERRFRDLPDWPRPRALVEHAAAALAAAVACLDQPAMQLARRMLGTAEAHR